MTILEEELTPVLAARFAEVELVYDAIEADTGMNYRYQLPSIRRLALALSEHRGALDASDTGVGKTPVACGVARTLGRDLFVVCPKSVIAPWRRIAALFDVRIEVINYEALRSGRSGFAFASSKFQGVRNGRELRRRQFVWNESIIDPESTLICFDDCHKMKDFRTWNCLMGVQALAQGYHVLGSSATAADNPMQMMFVALLTGLVRDPRHFYGWMLAHGVRKGTFGLEYRGGHGVLANIHRQIFPARGSRIRIADLGDLFPRTSIISEAYDMGAQATAEIQAVYAEMKKEIAKLDRRAAGDAANILVEKLRARQRAELLKVPTLVEMTQEAVDDGMSVVLVLNYTDSITAAAKRLKTQYTITGDDKMDARQWVIDRFNEDRIHLIVTNIKCGGTGISLQGTPNGRPRLELLSPSHSAIDMKQAFGRVPRIGGAPSIVKVVFAAGTDEEGACYNVRRKIRRIDTLNDGDLQV